MHIGWFLTSGLVQLVANLESFGYGHILLLSYNQGECEGLIKLIPSLGCVWTSFEFDPGTGLEERFLLWYLRCRRRTADMNM